MKQKICFPTASDPLFVDSCFVPRNLVLPSGFVSEGLPEYLPHRHLEIRARWTCTWSKELVKQFTTLRIAQGVEGVVRRLRDWALAVGKYPYEGVGSAFEKVAFDAYRTIFDPEKLRFHLEEILVQRWGLARYYQTVSCVDECYALAMTELSGAGLNSVLEKLFKSIRWSDRFLMAVNRECEVLGCEFSLPTNPVPWVLDCSIAQSARFVTGEVSSINKGFPVGISNLEI